MKINKKYFLLSLATVLAVTGATVGALSSAQTTVLLSCSTGSSVTVNQAAILTATGGNGSYFWSGANLTVGNSAGNQFAVSYPNPGTYSVNVSSAGQTAVCNVNVVGAPSTGSLACFPPVQNVVLGQVVTVSATGGDGSYVWSAPDLNISNPNGTSFTASYASTGLKTLTVTSAGLVTTCAINVLSNGTVPFPPAPVPPVDPGFPSTGGGFGQ